MQTFKSFCFCVVATLTACGQVSEDKPASGAPSQSDASESGVKAASYGAFEVSWSKASAAQLAARAHTVARVLLGRDLPSEPFVASVPSTIPNNLGFRTSEADTGEALDFRYFAEVDDLRVSNPTLDSDITTPKDVGRDGARQIFERAFDTLAQAGLVDKSEYDLSTARTSTTTTASGSSVSEDETIVTNSYDFLARRTINGIPFSNAGVRIRVHRGGRLTAIRLGGAQVASLRSESTVPSVRTLGTTGGRLDLKESPTGAGFVFEGTPDISRLAARFKKEFPAAAADRSGIEYMLPLSASLGGANKAVVEPLFVVSYSTKTGEMASRRRYLGYSIRDLQARPVDLSDKAKPEATGDVRQ